MPTRVGLPKAVAYDPLSPSLRLCGSARGLIDETPRSTLLRGTKRIYHLEFSADLTTPFTIVDTVQGSGEEILLQDPAAPPENGFYRVKVEVPAP